MEENGMTQPEQEEKRFTQSELNEILQRRLAREKRKRGALKLYVSYLEKLVHELAENGGKRDE